MELRIRQPIDNTSAVLQVCRRAYLQLLDPLISFFAKRSVIRKVEREGDKDLSCCESSSKRVDPEQQDKYLRSILDKHGNRILRLAYSYVHNMEDSEEILQDVLIKLLNSAPVFESSEHEKAWILRVTANLSKNRIEYNKLRDTDELNEELVAEKKEDLSFIWEAVRSLPENYREVIHLFYEEGYSTDEIADLLGESGANIRTRLKRARTKLKEILREEYDFDE